MQTLHAFAISILFVLCAYVSELHAVFANTSSQYVSGICMISLMSAVATHAGMCRMFIDSCVVLLVSSTQCCTACRKAKTRMGAETFRGSNGKNRQEMSSKLQGVGEANPVEAGKYRKNQVRHGEDQHQLAGSCVKQLLSFMVPCVICSTVCDFQLIILQVLPF